MLLSKEADAALKRDKREKRGAEARAQEKVALQSEARASFVVRSKRIAEARALALALEEEIAQSEIVLPEEREKQALAATSSAKLLRATKRIIDFKVNVHDSLSKQSCAI